MSIYEQTVNKLRASQGRLLYIILSLDIWFWMVAKIRWSNDTSTRHVSETSFKLFNELAMD